MQILAVDANPIALPDSLPVIICRVYVSRSRTGDGFDCQVLQEEAQGTTVSDVFLSNECIDFSNIWLGKNYLFYSRK